MPQTETYDACKGEPDPTRAIDPMPTGDAIAMYARFGMEGVNAAKDALSELSRYVFEPVPQDDAQAWDYIRVQVIRALGGVQDAGRDFGIIRERATGTGRNDQ